MKRKLLAISILIVLLISTFLGVSHESPQEASAAVMNQNDTHVDHFIQKNHDTITLLIFLALLIVYIISIRLYYKYFKYSSNVKHTKNSKQKIKKYVKDKTQGYIEYEKSAEAVGNSGN